MKFGLSSAFTRNGSESIGWRPINTIKTVGSVSETYNQATGLGISLFNNLITYNGTVDQIRLNINTASGTNNAKIKHVRFNYDKTVTVISSQTVTLTTGINTLIAGTHYTTITLGNRETIMVYVASTVGLKYADSSLGSAYGYYAYVGDVATGNALTFTATGKIAVELTITETSIKPTQYSTLEEYDLSTQPTGWTANSAYLFSGGKCTTGRDENSIYPCFSNYRFGADFREISIRFKYINIAATVYLSTKAYDGIQAGSLVSVNKTTLYVNAKPASGAYTATSLASQTLNVELTQNNYYRLTIKNEGKKIIASIVGETDAVNTSLEYTSLNYTYNPFPTPAYYEAGTAQGAPGFGSTGGTCEVYSFRHRILKSQNNYLTVIGDSNTEGYCNTDAQKYSSELYNHYGANKVIVTGIGGISASGSLRYVAPLIDNLRTKYAFVWISNDETGFVGNIRTLATMLKLCGIIPVFATAPSDATITTDVLSLDSEVQKISLHTYMNVNGQAGTTVKSELYTNSDMQSNSFNDGVHPNSTGHAYVSGQVKATILK